MKFDEEKLKAIEADITDNRYCDEDEAYDLIDDYRKLTKLLQSAVALITNCPDCREKVSKPNSNLIECEMCGWSFQV
jgi:hypothetical protein